MKIIYIVNAQIPNERAHGIQIVKTCESLALEGADLILILPKTLWHNKKSDIFDYYKLKNNFKVKRIFCFNFNFLGRIGFWVHASLFAFISFLYVIFFEKGKAVIYSRGETLLFIYKFFPGRFSIFWETHMKPEKRVSWHVNMMKKIDGIVTITNFYRQELIDKFYLPAEKITCIPDSVDREQFDISLSKEDSRKKLSLPIDKKIILYSGSLLTYDYKGVDVFLSATFYLPDDYLCVLVGGNNKDILKLRKVYKNNNIIFLGYQKPDMIPLYLKSADVLVLPNKSGDVVSEFYTSPMKLFEYMVSNRPIVASGLVSISEILNRNNAIIVEPNNPKALALGVIKAVEDGVHSSEISKKAYNDAINKYTWNKRSENLLRFIEKVVK